MQYVDLDRRALMDLILFVCVFKWQNHLIVGYFCNLAKMAQYLFGRCFRLPISREQENNNQLLALFSLHSATQPAQLFLWNHLNVCKGLAFLITKYL